MPKQNWMWVWDLGTDLSSMLTENFLSSFQAQDLSSHHVLYYASPQWLNPGCPPTLRRHILEQKARHLRPSAGTHTKGDQMSPTNWVRPDFHVFVLQCITFVRHTKRQQCHHLEIRLKKNLNTFFVSLLIVCAPSNFFQMTSDADSKGCHTVTSCLSTAFN